MTNKKTPKKSTVSVSARLERLRGELRAGTISYGDLAELESLAEYIDSGDVELLEAAGIAECPEDQDTVDVASSNVSGSQL